MKTGQIRFDLRGIGSELKERRLAVPIYQRSYAWTLEEVAEFWSDLKAAFSEGDVEYFLGTIVLTKEGSRHRDAIIDGQQRLATTSILFAAIRDVYRLRGDTKRADIVQNEYLSTSDLASAAQASRICLNSEDAHFFDQRIVAANDLPEAKRSSHELIIGAYEFLKREVKDVATTAGTQWILTLSRWVDFLSQNAKVISLEVPTDTDAFLIFETLNDRGADLTIADLLKNYLFGHAGSSLDTVRDGWMMVLGALEISAENKLFTTFLRHFWSSRHGAVRERELYKRIKERVTTQAQVVEFINDLQISAGFYSAFLNRDSEQWEEFGTGVKDNLETLRRLDLEQNRPLLLAALQHFAPPELKRLLRAMVSWSVRGLVVGGIGGGTAEKNYCHAALAIRRGDIKTTAELLNEISTIVPSDEEFRAAFAVATAPRAQLARYYLITLERARAGRKEPELVPNANEEEVNLEHVLPQRASEKDWGIGFNADERKAYVNRIGNLALLQKGSNGRIGNKAFKGKRAILAASSFALTAEIGAASEWTKDSIVARQKKMAEIAVKAWPRC